MKILPDNYVRLDERGEFIECVNSEQVWKSINGGFMKKGSVMGNHYHKKCYMLFFLLSGSAEMYMKHVDSSKDEVKKVIMNAPGGVIYEPLEVQAVKYLQNSTFLMLKSEVYNVGDNDTFSYNII